MINITSITDDLSDIPYKLIHYTDRIERKLRISRYEEHNFFSYSKLTLMVFQTGEIIGNNHGQATKVGLKDNEVDFVNEPLDSILIGRTNFLSVGPMVQFDPDDFMYHYSSAMIRFVHEDEVMAGLFHSKWEFLEKSNEIEKKLKRMQRMIPSAALYSQIPGEPLVGFDNDKVYEDVNHVNEALKTFQYSLKIYKRY